MWTKETDKRRLKPVLEEVSEKKVVTLPVEELKKEYNIFKKALKV